MRNILLLILIFVTPLLSAQEEKVTKSKLFSLFKKSILQNSPNSIDTYSHPWRINNEDGIYYKSDTIKLVNFISKSYRWSYCESVNWTFTEKKKFVLTRSHLCQEPPTRDVTTKKDWYDIKIIRFDNNLYIELYNLNELIERFKVLDIKRIENKIIVTLKRHIN